MIPETQAAVESMFPFSFQKGIISFSAPGLHIQSWKLCQSCKLAPNSQFSSTDAAPSSLPSKTICTCEIFLLCLPPGVLACAQHAQKKSVCFSSHSESDNQATHSLWPKKKRTVFSLWNKQTEKIIISGNINQCLKSYHGCPQDVIHLLLSKLQQWGELDRHSKKAIKRYFN